MISSLENEISKYQNTKNTNITKVLQGDLNWISVNISLRRNTGTIIHGAKTKITTTAIHALFLLLLYQLGLTSSTNDRVSGNISSFETKKDLISF